MNKSIFAAALRVCGLVLALTIFGIGQNRIPEPKDVLGFTPGDDFKLAHWSQIVDYFRKLDAASDRVIFKEIGKTTLGKPFTYAVISSPANLKKLDYYRRINDQLADPRKISRSDKKAAGLIKKGKTFVVITHGIHSTEVGSTLSSTLIAYRLASSAAKDIKKILDETIIVMVPSLNPDGVDIVKDWYDQTLGTKFEGTSPPELYHKYVGHDNNRDWYAFTQVETQLTVEKIHNVYHPQIVHDVHQQGSNAARFFVPPYEPPVEPNVPAEIIEGYTKLGSFIAAEMRAKGFEGITNNTTYDAWTPARAYSHYHGGVRILSETASADLATPINVKFEDLRGRRGFDAKKESKNFGPVWKGGKWSMRDITSYMSEGAFYLLKNAAEDRIEWLNRFYKIGKDATRPREKGEVSAYVVDFDQWNKESGFLRTALERGGVEIETVGGFTYDGKKYKNGSSVIRMNQPYSGFAKAMIESVIYPDLLDEEGHPIPPYDVTAHNLALLAGVEITPIKDSFRFPKQGPRSVLGDPVFAVECRGDFLYGAYKSSVPSMDEGWTRWAFKDWGGSSAVHSGSDRNVWKYCKVEERPVTNKDILAGNIGGYGAIVIPDQSPDEILKGYKEGSMPGEFTGGLEKNGVKNLRNYVENGGTLVFLNRSSDFAIEQFDLPVRNIAKNWKQKDFYIPGSILRTELDTSHPISKGMPERSIAWFERSPVFEVKTDAKYKDKIRMIARYPKSVDSILLSGWALGADRIAGKGALVEVKLGKGKIVLFGFRPQYRGQSLATIPLFFNSITD